jgi:hypothetical protein
MFGGQFCMSKAIRLRIYTKLMYFIQSYASEISESVPSHAFRKGIRLAGLKYTFFHSWTVLFFSRALIASRSPPSDSPIYKRELLPYAPYRSADIKIMCQAELQDTDPRAGD